MSNLKTLTLALALLAFLGAGYFLRFAQTPEQTAPPPSAAVASPCDLGLQPCRSRLPGGGTLTIELTPRPIPVLRPFEVRAILEGRDADRILLDFSGVNMDMGFNQVTLKKEKSGVFAGRAVLPVCSVGKMRWQANFSIRNGTMAEVISLRFETGNPPTP